MTSHLANAFDAPTPQKEAGGLEILKLRSLSFVKILEAIFAYLQSIILRTLLKNCKMHRKRRQLTITRDLIVYKKYFSFIGRHQDPSILQRLFWHRIPTSKDGSNRHSRFCCWYAYPSLHFFVPFFKFSLILSTCRFFANISAKAFKDHASIFD